MRNIFKRWSSSWRGRKRAAVALLALSLFASAFASAGPVGASELRYEQEDRRSVESRFVAAERSDLGPVLIDESSRNQRRGVGGFLGGAWLAHSQTCDITFDGHALTFQPDNARSAWVSEPWREECASTTTRIEATRENHMHLGYLNDDIGPCSQGPLGGLYAIVDDNGNCTDFDPLTEPRTAMYSHDGAELIDFRMVGDDGYEKFSFDRIRVVSGTIRVCVHSDDLNKFVANTGGVNARCWNLGEGYWNMSGVSEDTHRVTLTGHGSLAPFAFDDIRITEVH